MPLVANRQAAGLLACWLLLDAAIAVYLWFDGPSTVSRVLLAGGIALLLYVLIRRPPTGAPRAQSVELGLGVLLGISLLARVAVPYRPELPAPTVPIAGLALVALAALAVWGASWLANRARTEAGDHARFTDPRIAVLALAIIVAAGLAARFVIVAWDMKPGFDIYPIQEAAGNAVLAGQNPYLTHVYHSGYPYWPLSAVLAAAGLVVGDTRWSLLLADAVTVTAFVAIARNVGLPGRIGAIAGALFLWDSAGLYITWQSMTEPLVIAFTMCGIALLTARRPRGILAGIGFGLALATKQIAVGLVAMLLLTRQRQQQLAGVTAVVVAGLILLPFLARSPEAFVEGSIASHLAEQSRAYALNLLDPLPGIVPPIQLPFVITAIVALTAALIVRRRWGDGVDGSIAATIALGVVAFALIEISFVNYYQIPLALMLVLALLPEGSGSEEPRLGTS
jgi:hypothetical protein